MQYFNGKQEAQALDAKIQNYLKENQNLPNKPGIIQIGDNPSSTIYVALKKSLCERLGVNVQVFHISDKHETLEIMQKIKHITGSAVYSSVIIQMPLPINTPKSVLDLIPPDKDVDVLSTVGRNTFFQNNGVFVPPVVRAVEHFLKFSHLNVKNKKVVLIGESFLVGQPLAHYFINLGANVTMDEKYVRGKYMDAALVVSSTGVSALVDPQDIAPNACVIDFGSSVINGRTQGDIDSSTTVEHLKYFSPSPGGMGPLVVRYLLMNHLGI